MRVGRFASVHHRPLIPIRKPIVNVRIPCTFAEVRVGCRQTVVRGRRVRPAVDAANMRKTRDGERPAIEPRQTPVHGPPERRRGEALAGRRRVDDHLPYGYPHEPHGAARTGPSRLSKRRPPQTARPLADRGRGPAPGLGLPGAPRCSRTTARRPRRPRAGAPRGAAIPARRPSPPHRASYAIHRTS